MHAGSRVNFNMPNSERNGLKLSCLALDNMNRMLLISFESKLWFKCYDCFYMNNFKIKGKKGLSPFELHEVNKQNVENNWSFQEVTHPSTTLTQANLTLELWLGSGALVLI